MARDSWAHRGAVAALLVAAVAAPLARSEAHLGNISYSEIAVRDDAVVYRLKFAAHLMPGFEPDASGRLTRTEIVGREGDILAWIERALRVSTGGRQCRPSIVELIGPDTNDDLSIVLGYRCPSEVEGLRIDFHAFDETLPSFQNIATLTIGGKRQNFVFTAASPVLNLRDGAPAESIVRGRQRSAFSEFFALGVEHIWSGYDHLLFLLALLLPGGSLMRLAAIITSFTIAHSITLALASLGVVTLPAAPVEAAIAATIVYAAASAMRERSADHRSLLTFFLGLIHGFGFAGVLAELLPPGAVAVPLLAFNLGVEAGQLALVLATVPVLRLLLRGRRERPLRITVAFAILLAGTFWLAQRTTPFLTP